MWLSDRRGFLTGLAALALAGCGFRPVYGEGGAGRALRHAVRAADPVSPEDFHFVAALEEVLGRPDAPRFDLAYVIALREAGGGTVQGLGATRMQVFGTLDFTLTDAGTGAQVAQGQITGDSAYSSTGTQLATLTAAEDARLRLMRSLAERLVTRLYAVPGLTSE